jgi:hypothetical protein
VLLLSESEQSSLEEANDSSITRLALIYWDQKYNLTVLIYKLGP